MPLTFPRSSLRILILGPMEMEDGQGVSRPTRDLTALVRAMASNLAQARPASQPSAESARRPSIVVDGPDENLSQRIVTGLLEKLELADLVILDVSGSRPNVAYEAGLVHALGLPHIVLTSDDHVYFYFTHDAVILNFDRSRQFDPARRGHQPLYDRIEFFLDAWFGGDDVDVIEKLSRNQVSEFFDGLPIVDISAPAGIAAGYWRNSVRRFVRQDGYFDSPRRITWQRQQWPPRGEPRLVLEAGAREGAIAHFLAVLPPNDLTVSDADDADALRKALATLGLRQCFATIHLDDDKDIRDYGALVLGTEHDDGSVAIGEPLVVIELPTTLNALKSAHRILRIQKIQLRRPPGERKYELQRRYQDMIERFEYLVMHYVASEERTSEIADRFQIISLDKLGSSLKALGVLE